MNEAGALGGASVRRRASRLTSHWAASPRGRVRRGVRPLLAGLLMSVCAGSVNAEEPTLYERLALGPLVVLGRCQLAGRRASIDVRELFKGSYSEPRLLVSYRADNYNRAPGSAKIEFVPGVESVLILTPETDEDGRTKASNRFTLGGGARGKIELPAEGAAALIEAVRRIAVIQTLEDQSAVWDAQRALLEETNPLLVRAGFEEVLKFRLGEESLVPVLLGHLSGPRPEFRSLALKVIGQMFAAWRRRELVPPSGDLLVREALSHANTDDTTEVRAEAVRTLRETRRSDLQEAYSGLASRDPSQTVRYEAEIALLELRAARGAAGPSPSPVR